MKEQGEEERNKNEEIDNGEKWNEAETQKPKIARRES